MIEIIKNKQAEITRLAKKYEIKEVYLFGSATGKTKKKFNSQHSDIDLSIVFEKEGYFENISDFFFRFEEELTQLFKPIPVDLGQYEKSKKKYFLEYYNKSKIRIV